MKSSSLPLGLIFCLFLVFVSFTSQVHAIEIILSDSLHGLPDNIDPLGQVIAVVFDPDGSLFILEESGNRLIHLDSNGGYLDQAGGFGFGEGAFQKPGDLALVGLELWVTDIFGGRIVRFDRYFAPLGVFGKTLSDDGELPFERPVSVAQAASGDLVIIESDRVEALLLNNVGRLIDNFAQYGELQEGLISPRRVEIARSGIIAIADPGRKSVLLFDRFGSSKGYRNFPFDGDGPLGIAWQGNSLWMCGAGGIALANQKANIEIILTNDNPDQAINDLAIQGNRLAVATANRVLIYRVSRNEN